jgi:hypothetical protein
MRKRPHRKTPLRPFHDAIKNNDTIVSDDDPTYLADDLDADFRISPGDTIAETLVAVTQTRPARPRSELNLAHLNPCEITVIDEWFAHTFAKPYHAQVKEGSLALRALPQKTSYDRIGLIFGVKRSTIAADGASLRPMVVVPRLTTETELYEHGYPPDKAIVIKIDRDEAKRVRIWVTNKKRIPLEP